MVRLEKNTVIFLLIASFVVFIDQLTKFLFRNLGKGVYLIGNYLIIVPSKNYGAGFSLLQGRTSLLVWFAVFVIGIIVYYYYDIPNKLRTWVALLLGGTIGNLIDRVFLGYATDFVDINIWSGYLGGIYLKIWPAFNLADVAIFAGIISLVIYYWKEEKVNRKMGISKK